MSDIEKDAEECAKIITSCTEMNEALFQSRILPTEEGIKILRRMV